jgi:hypothetical protein
LTRGRVCTDFGNLFFGVSKTVGVENLRQAILSLTLVYLFDPMSLARRRNDWKEIHCGGMLLKGDSSLKRALSHQRSACFREF